MADSVSISPIEQGVHSIEATLGDVRALLVCGDRFTALLDSLSRPADLDAVRPLIEERGRPLLIVNSHADWDHWWGNAAFPDVPVIAHRLTRDRQRRAGARELARMQARDPENFAGVTLRPATVAFDGELTLDLGGQRLELSLLPGHVPDELVAWIPERRLLFAADAAEDPIPLVGKATDLTWPDRLLAWARRARIVVPSHGGIAGPELLRRNAAYLRSLLETPRPEGSEDWPEFYRRAHRRNFKRFPVARALSA